MAFEGLTQRLQQAFGKMRGKGKLTEEDVKLVMREVRMALLEADVNFTVVKDFIKKVTERAVGALRASSTASARPNFGGSISTRATPRPTSARR